MWSDFLYFSKTERTITLVLMVVVVVLLTGLFVKPYLHLPDDEDAMEADSLAVRQFDEEMERQRSVASSPLGHRSKEKPCPPVKMHPFDPNSADSTELRELGLSAFVAHNIVGYRRAGGRFRNVRKLSEIYGMDDSTFRRLEPFVRIEPQPSRRTDSTKVVGRPVGRRMEFVRQEKFPEGTKVDVNQADTTELKKVPGVGSVIAAMIVGYRERLGGYHDVNQLLEVRYVTPELLRWFVVGTVELRKVRVNHDGLERMRMHPYINFYQAKAFVQYRRKEGKIESLSPFTFYTEEFTEKDLQRIAPYVSFD
ncbi:MAG: helix-hairpin-helix domain-containing protein [Bacteroidales bacterium]|nr:helix-hairpin-helix domain-containing protein [Bacteroidales bacterium]